MSQKNTSGIRTFGAGEPISSYLRVKLIGDDVYVAGDEADIGSAGRPAFEVGDDVPVVSAQQSGTVTLVAAEPITKGSDVYSAAGGKVATAGAIRIGTAFEDAMADGDFIEVQRVASGAGGGGSSAPAKDDSAEHALYLIVRATNGNLIEPTAAEVAAANGGVAPASEDGDKARVRLSNGTVEWYEYRAGAWGLADIEVAPGLPIDVQTFTLTALDVANGFVTLADSPAMIFSANNDTAGTPIDAADTPYDSGTARVTIPATLTAGTVITVAYPAVAATSGGDLSGTAPAWATSGALPTTTRTIPADPSFQEMQALLNSMAADLRARGVFG